MSIGGSSGLSTMTNLDRNGGRFLWGPAILVKAEKRLKDTDEEDLNWFKIFTRRRFKPETAVSAAFCQLWTE